MTEHIPAATGRANREPPPGVRQTVRSLRQAFPGWAFWYGMATRRWWGLPPAAFWYQALMEAATADELAMRVRQLAAVDSHAPFIGQERSGLSGMKDTKA